MPDINLVAVLLCGVGSLVLGGLWYSPLLFARPWQRLSGVPETPPSGGRMAAIFGLAFLLSRAAAFVFAMFLGRDMPLSAAVGAGVGAGLFWVAAAFGINYLFERRPLGLWLINGGYHTLQFAMFGAVIGAMG